MATYTTNYNLSKPDASDQFSAFRTSYNQNMDIIDQNLGGGGGGSSTLAGLNDVSITSAQDGQVLKYDANSSEWINANESSGGDTVSWTEVQQSGTKIAAIDINGTSTDVYAPTPPTKTSDLVNDSNFVSDASYVHTDNNFTSAYETKLGGIEAGAEVNVQSDWSQADNTADDYIKNKPTIPTKTSDLANDSGFLDSSDITVTQIQTTGTKIATIDVDGTSTDLYAPSGGGGFSAFLIITAGTGLTVTASNGGTTLTATETSTGTYEVMVDAVGTWTVSDGTNSATVVVSAQTVYYVTIISVPDGSTVTPTDDISIWLACGQRSEAYTTLSQVLADSTCLSALISDNNAMDYLVRSTTWASGITADSSAMSYIGLDNYASNTLLADSTWNTAIQNSTYFESVDNVKVPVMTSDNTPSGVASASSFYNASYAPYKAFDSNVSTSWATLSAGKAGDYLEYEFPNFFVPKKISISVSYMNVGGSYRVQGYNIDTNTWDTFFTRTMTSTGDNYTHIMNNLNNYKKFRWYCSSVSSQQYSTNIREFQIYGRADI